MNAHNLLEELRNVSKNEPLFAGDTISHATANELVAMRWAKRDANGDFVVTDYGRHVLGFETCAGCPS